MTLLLEKEYRVATEPVTPKNIFHFGPFVLDGKNFQLEKSGQPVTITPRAFDVLVLLLSDPQNVVEKQQIFDAVWKDTFVTDNALTKIVKEIRQALGDSAESPRYIETVPKRGYRFIGEINSGETIIDAPENETEENIRPQPVFKNPKLILAGLFVLLVIAGVAGWAIINSPDADPKIRSIAVLPFKPLDPASRDESLEMGMAETLINRLNNLRQVAVRPMNSVRRFAGSGQDTVSAGRDLNADAVLEGSIQKAGERVRITVRLVEVASGEPLWSEKFDENFTDIFTVQDSIAEKVVGALALHLSRQEKEQLVKHPTDHPEAYQLYLQGQLIWNRRGENWIEQSLASHQQALEKDPNFALAHIGVADAFMMLSGHRKLNRAVAGEKARTHILRALEIDNDLAQAHNALAEFKYQYEYDWNGAGAHFKTAIALNPNIAWIHQAYGWYLMSLGDLENAKTEMDRARELDPSSLTINIGRGRLYYYSRQYDEAIRHFENIIAAEPRDVSAYYALQFAYIEKKMYPEAIESIIKLNGFTEERAKNTRDTFNSLGWEGFWRNRLEYLEKNADKDPGARSVLVYIYARIGEKDKAFYWLDKVVADREHFILQMKVEPAFDPLRDDPRFAVLLGRIGLKP